MKPRHSKCEMIHAHHPDCTCQWCMAHLDERCAATAVGAYERVRVCEECAIAMSGEGFTVVYDDGRAGPVS